MTVVLVILCASACGSELEISSAEHAVTGDGGASDGGVQGTSEGGSSLDALNPDAEAPPEIPELHENEPIDSGQRFPPEHELSATLVAYDFEPASGYLQVTMYAGLPDYVDQSGILPTALELYAVNADGDFIEQSQILPIGSESDPVSGVRLCGTDGLLVEFQGTLAEAPARLGILGSVWFEPSYYLLHVDGDVDVADGTSPAPCMAGADVPKLYLPDGWAFQPHDEPADAPPTTISAGRTAVACGGLPAAACHLGYCPDGQTCELNPDPNGDECGCVPASGTEPNEPETGSTPGQTSDESCNCRLVWKVVDSDHDHDSDAGTPEDGAITLCTWAYSVSSIAAAPRASFFSIVWGESCGDQVRAEPDDPVSSKTKVRATIQCDGGTCSECCQSPTIECEIETKANLSVSCNAPASATVLSEFYVSGCGEYAKACQFDCSDGDYNWRVGAEVSETGGKVTIGLGGTIEVPGPETRSCERSRLESRNTCGPVTTLIKNVVTGHTWANQNVVNWYGEAHADIENGSVTHGYEGFCGNSLDPLPSEEQTAAP